MYDIFYTSIIQKILTLKYGPENLHTIFQIGGGEGGCFKKPIQIKFSSINSVLAHLDLSINSAHLEQSYEFPQS